MTDPRPRYVCLHQIAGKGYAVSVVLDSWYCYSEVGKLRDQAISGRGKPGRWEGAPARAERLARSLNAEHDAWLESEPMRTPPQGEAVEAARERDGC